MMNIILQKINVLLLITFSFTMSLLVIVAINKTMDYFICKKLFTTPQ